MKLYHLFFAFTFGLCLTFASCSDDDPLVTEEEMEVVENEEETEDEVDSDLDDAPAFDLKTADDVDLSSKTYDGKTLVIFFFGNGCPPCKAVAPDIETKLNQAFKDNEDFAIIGIDQWDGNAASVEGFQESTGVTFPLGIQGSGTAREYDTTYDRLVIVKKSGKIGYRGNAIAANNLDEVIGLVESFLD